MNARQCNTGISGGAPGRLIRLATALALGALAAPAQAGSPFLDAQDAFRRGNATRLEAATKKLGRHPLRPYVEYYRWRLHLENSVDAEADALMVKNDGDLLGEIVRADWMRQLARKGRWDRFDTLAPGLQTPDGDLRCLLLESRQRRQDESMIEDARKLWRGQAELPESCSNLFQALFDRGVFTEPDIWERARQQIDNGRHAVARRTLALLPSNQTIDDKTWASLNNRTPQFLDGVLANQEIRTRNRELASLAILRLARPAPEMAADYLRRLEQRAPGEAWAALWWAVGTQGAMQHRPEALDWFARAHHSPAGDEQLRWAVRAALRAGDWKRVRALIETMPPALADEPAWIYWLGRALKAEGKHEAARVAWERIAGQSHFYGLLATEELDRSFRLPPRAPTPSGEEIARIAKLDGIQRALAFFELDLRTEGIREWNWTLRGMNDRQLLATAEYAKRQHIYDRAINTAEKTQNEHDYGLRYLTPYDTTVRPAAKALALDDAWVYGLMRQESRFVTAARSSVGAQGLMQLMPATARWVARKLGMRDYRPGKVADLNTNVRLGTSYLKMVLDSLDQHPVLASAAYNAGPGRARRWRDPERVLEGAIYAETIPFSETRDYVKKVLANAVIYTSLLSGRADSLKARLGVVKPASGSPPPEEVLP